MRKIWLVVFGICWLGWALAGARVQAQPSAEPAVRPEPGPELWPEIQPYETGHLKVSPLHEMYFEQSGNPQGAPVLIVHGGPGGGSFPRLRRYHDPKRWRMVLFDQRGAGKSRPAFELRDNNTPALVEDMEKLRQHLGLGKVHVFGGSWGATLALAYAERYPHNVRSLVLRGLFTGTRREIDSTYHGGAATFFFPEAYARFQAALPHPERRDYPAQLVALLQSADPAERQQAARAFLRYAMKLGNLENSDAWIESQLDPIEEHVGPALIENPYMAHGCFLRDGQLLAEAGRLRGIPTILINGRYDMLSPPDAAYALHRKIPGSRLVIVEAAGHGGGEPRIRGALLEAVRALEAGLKTAPAR
jgi:proline iminopeptidase